MATTTGRVAVCTIISKNYLAFARVLADSLHAHHPDVPLFVLLADDVGVSFDPAAERFALLELRDLAIPGLRRFLFHYSRRQVISASKPYLLDRLLDRGFERAVYLDADMLVLDDLSPVLQPTPGSSMLLTPHLLEPLSGPDRHARELNILQSGSYNGGLIAVSETPIARRILAWWQARLYQHCREAIPEGMYFNQRWLDLIPVFFEDVTILREPGYNVAHWNLTERPVQLIRDAASAGGHPIRLFHFSGFTPDSPLAVTTHSGRLSMRHVGQAAVLFERYWHLLERAGFHHTKSWSYAHDTFDNGVPIPAIARQMFLDLGDAVEAFGDPFEAARPSSFYNWLNEPVDRSDGRSPRVTRLWQAVHQQRPDVQHAFPDPLGADREAFLAWTAASGLREHDISARFLSGQQFASS